MHCPSCDRAQYSSTEPCPDCGVSGDPALIEELSHLDWVLDEIDTWAVQGLRDTVRERLWKRYADRQRELEVALGLRLPLFSEKEARQAWPQLFQLEALRSRVIRWLQKGLLTSDDAQRYLDRLTDQIDDLLEHQAGDRRSQTGGVK